MTFSFHGFATRHTLHDIRRKVREHGLSRPTIERRNDLNPVPGSLFGMMTPYVTITFADDRSAVAYRTLCPNVPFIVVEKEQWTKT